MSNPKRPFSVTVEQVREWIEYADKKHAAVIDHENGGPLPEGMRIVFGMQVSDARAWMKYDMRQKIATALMNLRPRSIYTAHGVTGDKCQWMEFAIPEMVEELLPNFEPQTKGGR